MRRFRARASRGVNGTDRADSVVCNTQQYQTGHSLYDTTHSYDSSRAPSTSTGTPSAPPLTRHTAAHDSQAAPARPPLTDEAHDDRPCAQHALAYTLSSLTKPNHHAPPLSPTYKAHQSAHKGTIRFNDLSPISCLRAGREKKDTACRRGGGQFNARPSRWGRRARTPLILESWAAAAAPSSAVAAAGRPVGSRSCPSC